MILLTDLLRIKNSEVISLVGGGGKTTTLFRLAQELSGRGRSVLCSTTTRMNRPTSDCYNSIVLCRSKRTVKRFLPRFLKAGTTTILTEKFFYPRKMYGISPEWIDYISTKGWKPDISIVEADGSKQLPLKGHAPHEPVVPTSTSLLLPIVGFEIFDAPLTKDIAHRSEIISEITGIQIGETITVEILSSLLRKGNGYLKGYKPKMRVIPILTKVPPDARKKAIEIAEKLLADFPEFESVVIGNLARDGGIPELWQERVERQNTEFQPTLTINEQIPIWKNLPVLSVCGHKNSGKTTLLEKTICELKKRGLKIAAVKHDVHCITVDQPGTDSDRLYRAGASVLLRGEPEVFQRQDMESGINQLLYKLAESHDIVLVEGYKKLPLPKVWVLREDETAPPNEAENILGVLPWNSRREVHLLEIIDQWLSEVVQQSRIAACVLIGGSSKRMKNPKHLLQDKGVSWIERTVDMVSSCVEQVVISGNGELPTTLSHLTRLPDITEAKGPMAGILAAMRWSPRTSWLFIPCDLPGLTPQAIRWLLDQRKTGRWVIYPRIPGRTHFEPLFAIYDFRITASLEKLTDEGDFCPFAFLPMAQAWIPEIPKQHAAAWQNVNSPEQLLAFHNQQNKEKLL